MVDIWTVAHMMLGHSEWAIRMSNWMIIRQGGGTRRGEHGAWLSLK